MRTTPHRRLLLAALGALIVALLAVVPAVPAQQAKSLNVSLGGSITITADDVSKLAVADPNIADVVPLSDREISVIGKKAGMTTLTIVHTGDKATEMFTIVVGIEPAAAVIRELTGSSDIKIRAIGDTLVLDGSVEDELQLQRASQVAGAYYAKVLNMLEVRKPRQVKISIRVAEVARNASKQIGFKWLGADGSVRYAIDFSGLPLGTGKIAHGLVGPPAIGGGATSPLDDDIGADVILQALETHGYAQILSEPTLITMSGQEASFLVGKEVPITQQLPQSFTVEYKEVGVRMKVKPVVDSTGKIHTTLHSEVSQISDTVPGGLGNTLFVITTKQADTVLQLNDGQTMVIGGLLENAISPDTIRKVPWLADIPIFGIFFRHKSSSQAQGEVLFFLKPEVIKDIEADVAAAPRSPLMRDWALGKSNEKPMQMEPKAEDWGLHNPGHMGLPEEWFTPKPAAPAAPAPAPAPAK